MKKGTLTNRPEEAQSAILRRHLMDLTQGFIIPLVCTNSATKKQKST